MPTINKPFLLKLVLVGLVLVGLVVAVHEVQADRIPAALKRQADRNAEAGKTDAAIHYLRQYLEFAPHDVDAQVQLVELLRRRNPTARGQAELIFLYDRILRLDPGRHAVRRDALATCLRAGRYSDAVAHAEALLREFPTEASLWQQLGAAQAALNQLAEARASYERAVALEPHEPVGYQRLAQLLWRNVGDAAAARAVLDRMVRAAPQDPDAHLVRARFETFLLDEPVAATAPDLKQAVVHLHRVLELDPENAEASLLLADILQRERKLPAALAVLRDLFDLYPGDIRVARSLSWLELARGNAPAAVAVLEDGLKAVPDGLDLLVPLADLLLQHGDTARAQQILRRLEQKKAPAVQVKYLQARLAMQDRQWAEAVRRIEALRNEITNLPALETQLNLLLAVCAEQLGDVAGQEKALQRVIRAEPKNVAARTGLANLYLRLGRFEEAARELEAAAQSPFASGAVVAQWVRTRAHLYRVGPATPEDWRKLEAAAAASAARFALGSSEPVRLQAEVLAAAGKHAEAVNRLRQEAARRPGDARLWAALAAAVADRTGTPAGLAVLDEAQAACGDTAELRLARARLSAAEPGRIRPLAPLADNIDSWSEAEQHRLLAGLVEVFDAVGDQPAVVRTLRALASRRPADPVVWLRLHERAGRIGDQKTRTEARAALARLGTVAEEYLWLCDADAARPDDAPTLLTRGRDRFGPDPTRSDVCLALARLYRLSGDEAEAARLLERAFTLEPTHFEATRAWLTHLGTTGDEARLTALTRRLAHDPRWAGEPFRRLIAICVSKLKRPAATALLNACRPFVEREPGGLGWLAEMAARHQVFPPDALLREAVSSPLATADDWLRLALWGRPEDLNAAKARLPVPAYLAAAAVLRETSAGRDFAPVLTTPAEVRGFAQARLAVKLSRHQPAEAIRELEGFLALKDLPPADAAWAKRNLALLYAVGGTPEDRKRATDLLAGLTDDGATPEEQRATAGVLTTLARYLEGADRVAVLTRAAAALDRAYRASGSPKDLFTLAQLYRATGNRAEARKCLQELLNADPANLDYLLAAVEELVEDQNYAAAATFAKQLLDKHGGEFRAVAAAARLEARAGRPETALALAEGYARVADPAAGDHLTRSARVAELLDELSRLPNVRGTPAGRTLATAAAERYAALIPTRVEAVIGLAGVLSADGRAAEAFHRLERLDRYLPPRVRAAAGLAAVRSGPVTDRQAEQARAWIEACLAEEPDAPLLLLQRAELLALRNDLAGAAADYERVLAAEPRNVIALNNLAWIWAADPRTADQALELVARATREVGLTGDLLDTRARARITLKQFQDAERDLTDAIRQQPTGLRWFHLAMSRLGQTPPRTEDAAKAFREAKRRGLEPRGVHPADRATYDALEAGMK